MVFAELESSKKQAEQDKKAIDDLVRERDILNKVSSTTNTVHDRGSLFFFDILPIS